MLSIASLLVSISVEVCVSNPYTQVGLCTLPTLLPVFVCFFNVMSHLILSTLLHAAAQASTLLCTSLLLPPPSLTHCSVQVHKSVHGANDLSINFYMQVHLVFTYPYYLSRVNCLKEHFNRMSILYMYNTCLLKCIVSKSVRGAISTFNIPVSGSRC